KGPRLSRKGRHMLDHLGHQELAKTLSAVARLYLEIQAGHRSAKALRRLTTPTLQLRLDDQVRRGGRMVVDRDIVSGRYDFTTPNRLDAVVVVRGGEDTCRALIFELRRRNGRWWLTDIASPETAGVSQPR
ncbi:MAG: Rv3235 family protein, partial [Actinomycetota bacterium]|nr:Rv3235 family protein [Actinomycetota bacterium]